MRKPLAGPALFFAGGIAVSFLAPSPPATPALCAAAFALLALFSRIRRSPRLARACVCLAFAALGILNASLHPVPAAPTVAFGPQRLEGCVVESSVERNGRLQFTLQLPSGRARVSIPAGRQGLLPPALAVGRRVAVDARLRPIRGFHNPGSFDLELYMARRGIFWNAAAVRGQAPEVLPGFCGPAWRRSLDGARAAALARIDALYPGDGYHAAMLGGLLLGDKSRIRRIWIEEFRQTGTYHALVISGSHITLVCGFFLLWRRWSGFGERSLLLLAGLTAWLYALLAGGDPPVLRAAAGFALFVLGSLLYRRTSVLNVLAAVALVFLAIDPGQLFEASFLLSFLAVAAMGAFAPESGRGAVPDPRELSRRVEEKLLGETVHFLTRLPSAWARRAVRLIFAAASGAWALFRLSALVQAGLALPMVLLFHRLSLTGLTANVFVVPLISCSVPLGFLGVFTGWRWAAASAAWFLDLARHVAAWHVRFEPQWRVPDPPAWLAAAIPCALLAWALVRRPAWRRVCAAASLSLIALMALNPFPPATTPGTFELSALDVGQGESLVLALPDGQFAVVDTGGLPQFARRQGDAFDIGEDVVSPYLWSRGVRRLAFLALTHLHDDHSAGALALLRNFRPRELWTSFAPSHPTWLSIAAEARRLSIPVRVLRQGDQFTAGGIEWETLAPAPRQPWTGRPRNNDSLVLRLTHGRHSFLLTGDIERAVEARLLEEAVLRPVQVLKIAHHGSRLSTLPVLLERLQPAVALISAGEGNSYGLPSRETLAALDARRTLVLRTDRDGHIAVSSDGRRLTLRSLRLDPRPSAQWDLF